MRILSGKELDMVRAYVAAEHLDVNVYATDRGLGRGYLVSTSGDGAEKKRVQWDKVDRFIGQLGRCYV